MLTGARRLLLLLPNGRVRRALLALVFLPIAAGAQTAPPPLVLEAEYTEPTDRYGHGVLGDEAEWGALRLTVDECAGCNRSKQREVLIRLPDSRVFEDVAPRLVDLDFDNAPEVVAIESDSSRGSRLAIYGAGGLITATPFIGNAFRWLAPVGAADLDGDGVMELAYVDRPHLAKILRVWRYEGRRLTEVAALPGLSNHRIGEPYISGGIRDCGAGPEVITADANWRQIMATKLAGGSLTTRPVGPFEGRASFDRALGCAD
jgi:VCBS repeat protein